MKNQSKKKKKSQNPQTKIFHNQTKSLYLKKKKTRCIKIAL